LVSKISHELPQLTVHDISHLDALWSIADTLLGDNYDINPAEVYVLAMCFLFHDAATSSFAYPGGIDALRETIEWKDFVAQRGADEKNLDKGTADFQLTLFETLRILHAKHAEFLPSQSWKDLNGIDRYLVEDVELRNHYGAVIGKLAASHGQDSSDVEAEWAYVPPLSAHSSLNLGASAKWNVDRLKVAMLIRCIDAAHIDNLRAPDFHAALIQPEGESHKHWLFQNRLSAIEVNDKNQVYWSGSAFGVAEADAWWRCFETCKMVDHELKTSNRILEDHAKPVLRVNGVMGADDIETFKKNVPVEGWHPLDFNFRVTQVGSIIEKFGGKRLYGDNPTLALRELIQNSADAIRARRLYTGDLNRGRIEITLRLTKDGHWWLDVQDDGLGMSRYVLTEVLLDFGRSLWKDTALRGQWSGLASSGFSAVGQFGIGFFSIFMLGDEVKVSTWRYGAAIDDQITLHLRNRVVERPILLKTPPSGRLAEPGTKISVRLKNGKGSLLPEVWKGNVVVGLDNDIDYKKLDVVVGRLAPALDIDLWTKDGDEDAKKTVAANDWKTIDAKTLLRRLDLGIDNSTINKFDSLVSDICNPNGEIIGRAALHTSGRYTSTRQCILVHRGIYSGNADGIIGILNSENSADLARKRAFPVASAVAMKQWAKNQMINHTHSTPILSERLVSLGVQKEELVVGRLDGVLVSISDVIDYLKLKNLKELVCVTSEIECPDEISESDFKKFSLNDGVLDLSDSSSENRFDFGLAKWIEKILPHDDEHPKTLMKMIDYFLRIAFPNLYVEEEIRVVAQLDGVDFEESCTVFTLKLDE